VGSVSTEELQVIFKIPLMMVPSGYIQLISDV